MTRLLFFLQASALLAPSAGPSIILTTGGPSFSPTAARSDLTWAAAPYLIAAAAITTLTLAHCAVIAWRWAHRTIERLSAVDDPGARRAE